MREYELIIVLTPTLTQEEVSGIHERVKGLITERGGDISFEDMWGMRRLAYPLRKAGAKFLEGNYILFSLQLRWPAYQRCRGVFKAVGERAPIFAGKSRGSSALYHVWLNSVNL